MSILAQIGFTTELMIITEYSNYACQSRNQNWWLLPETLYWKKYQQACVDLKHITTLLAHFYIRCMIRSVVSLKPVNSGNPCSLCFVVRLPDTRSNFSSQDLLTSRYIFPALHCPAMPAMAGLAPVARGLFFAKSPGFAKTSSVAFAKKLCSNPN